MLANCRFLQHCQIDAADISYDEWLAMLTNVARASDGVVACHDLSRIDTKRYDEQQVQKKIDEVLTHMAPATCEYIQKTLHFNDCDACQVKCPSSWSLAGVPKARAIVRDITILRPTPCLRRKSWAAWPSCRIRTAWNLLNLKTDAGAISI